jgi:curved DNA-binding protein CbpA
MMHGFQLDPHAVLGVAPGAPLQDVRDAYRAKSKKHHPDHGGDEWAFRVVVRAYEILSTAPATARESHTRPQEPAASPRPHTAPRPGASSSADRIRPGIQDKISDPSRIIDVEILWLRYQVHDLFELTAEDAEDQNLSGSLNIVWPSATATQERNHNQDAEILRLLDDVFDDMRTKTRVVSSRCKREATRFTGWLSYPSGDRAWNAFKVLHELLNARKLGVRQWTRDMIIPKE